MKSAAMSKALPPGTRMIRTKDVAASLTCLICFKVHRNTISVSECMHSYCKRCILQKILEEDQRCCPACGIDLGANPLSTLRRDPQLRSLVSNIFHSIKKNIEEEPNVPEEEARETEIVQVEDDEPEMPSIPIPARKKARSLSSFVTSPTVKMQRNRSQCSNQPVPSKDAEQRKPTHVWDLNCPAEAVNDTMKDSKPRSQGIVIKTPPSTIPKDKPNFSIAGKGKQCMNTSNVITIDDDEEEKDHKPLPPALPVPKPRGRPRGSRQKKSVAAPSSEGVRISPQVVVDAAANERRITSAWFQLVATYKRKSGPPLRQIRSNFLRIKDIRVSVLFIKKHIVKKLGLQSEDEVEIEMQGVVLPDDMQLYSVMNFFQIEASPEKVLISLGSSAKDFVMSLGYSRKA